jgi:hypothetical protein
MKNKRNLLVKYALLVVMPMFVMTSCYCKKELSACDNEKLNLEAAKNKEAQINKEFNKMADSCVYYYAPQMPQTIVRNAYNDLKENNRQPYTKLDSVRVLVNRVGNISEQYKYDVMYGAIRTGTGSLRLWGEYQDAMSKTESARKLFTECRDSQK